MVDTLATIAGFDMRTAPFPGPDDLAKPQIDFDPYTAPTAALTAPSWSRPMKNCSRWRWPSCS